MPDLPPPPSTNLSPPAIVRPAEVPASQPLSAIVPGAIWPDDRGKHIQAHGGGITRVGDTYYWFGEDRSRDNVKDRRYVACYASKDLVNWQFRRQVVDQAMPEDLGNWWALERPKVFYNVKTKKYVMYAHIDGKGGYKFASVATYTCDTVDGDYQYVRSFRPLGLESRDIGQFVDDDGSAYLIFECRPAKGFYIAALSDDYLDVTRVVCFIKSPLEGGAIVKHEGLYYALGSAMTGWNPNPNKFATAERLEGPWSAFRDIAPPKTRTYGSQSTMLLKIAGSEKTTVIYIGDMWRPKTHWDSRYLWMPVELGGGEFRLPEPRPWTIDMKTGVVTFK